MIVVLMEQEKKPNIYKKMKAVRYIYIYIYIYLFSYPMYIDSSDYRTTTMTPPPVTLYNYTMDNENNFTDNCNNDTTTAHLEYGMISSMIPTTANNNWITTQSMMDANTMILNGNGDNNGSTHTSPRISSTVDYSNKVMKRRKGIGNTPQEIYARVQRPYNYAESYHYLIQYVKHRMGRNELIRISRALVLFRPSYMSCVASLTEEDLIYMEKCVQRTLLEFEKLISFSGTPTVVWRRTGEIVLVGKEFLLLTQWSKEILLGKKTYIYEVNYLLVHIQRKREREREKERERLTFVS
jgi:hypothetical protein